MKPLTDPDLVRVVKRVRVPFDASVFRTKSAVFNPLLPQLEDDDGLAHNYEALLRKFEALEKLEDSQS